MPEPIALPHRSARRAQTSAAGCALSFGGFRHFDATGKEVTVPDWTGVPYVPAKTFHGHVDYTRRGRDVAHGKDTYRTPPIL